MHDQHIIAPAATAWAAATTPSDAVAAREEYIRSGQYATDFWAEVELEARQPK